MNHVTGEITEVILAADSMNEDDRRMVAWVLWNQANKASAEGERDIAECLHSVSRLLSRVTEIQNAKAKALRKADRKASLMGASTKDERAQALHSEFDRLTAGL